MRKIILLFSSLFFTANLVFCQQPRPSGSSCQNGQFDREVASLLSFSVAPIDVDSLKTVQHSVVLLDAREPKEFAISHIEGAVNCGYDNFDGNSVKNLNKNAPIVIYCSVGYRSEQIGKKLKKMGFLNVRNLYGSIFEWINRGNFVVDKNGKTTNKVHTFNKNWSKWVNRKNVEKIY
ncbi:MAG: hypothetical protein RL757_1658 [Bacteroidota bacterium]